MSDFKFFKTLDSKFTEMAPEEKADLIEWLTETDRVQVGVSLCQTGELRVRFFPCKPPAEWPADRAVFYLTARLFGADMDEASIQEGKA